MRKFWFLKIAAMGIVAILVGGFAVMSLWNWLIPAIFGLTSISLLQAFGLLVLSKILFGSFGGRGHGGCGGRHHYWKQKMTEKWENMTPEERETMKNDFKSQFRNWKTKLES